jgi:hypothetical protein
MNKIATYITSYKLFMKLFVNKRLGNLTRRGSPIDSVSNMDNIDN